jgi:hypothetical protein
MRIRLIDSNKERLAELGRAVADLPAIELQWVQQAVYIRPPSGLDMIFMTLPTAERWNPDFKSREAQIIATSIDDQQKGLPPLIVTGVNLTVQDPKDPVSQVRIVLESVLSAVRRYKDRNSGVVEVLGFWVMDLTRGVTTDQLSDLLHKELSLK